MEKVEILIFDLGGVLLDIDYNLTRKAFEALGVVHFDEMYSQSTADQLFRKLETGKIQEEDFYKEFNYCTGLHLSPSEIKKAWNAMLLDVPAHRLDLLVQLKPLYKTFLLSNTNETHITAFEAELYQRHGVKDFSDYFEEVFYSCRMSMRKPDAEIFQHVLTKHNLVPEQTIFIDDSIQHVKGAGQCGIRSYLLPQGMEVKELLKELKLL